MKQIFLVVMLMAGMSMFGCGDGKASEKESSTDRTNPLQATLADVGTAIIRHIPTQQDLPPMNLLSLYMVYYDQGDKSNIQIRWVSKTDTIHEFVITAFPVKQWSESGLPMLTIDCVLKKGDDGNWFLEKPAR